MRKLVVRILLWAVIPALTLYGGLYLWTLSAEHAFERGLDRLRAAGDPVEWLDLAPPPVPDDENAAPLLEQAQRLYEDRRLGRLELYNPVHEWSEEDWTGVRNYVRACGEYVELLERAVDLPHCRFESDWEPGTNFFMRNVWINPEGQRVLRLRALLQGRDSDPVAAARSLRLALELADKMGRNTVLEYALRCAIYGYVADTLSEIAMMPGFDAKHMRASLDAYFEQVEDQQRLESALKGERTLGLWCIRQWLDGKTDVLLLMVAERLDVTSGSIRARVVTFLATSPGPRRLAFRDGVRFLDMSERAIEILLDDTDAEARIESLVEEIEALDAAHVMTRALVRLPGIVHKVRMRLATNSRLARIALAALEHRQETGAWPRSLGDLAQRLGGAVPGSPLTNEPFVYELTAEGAVLGARQQEGEELYPVWKLRDG